jgi:hypothetical protein
MFEKMGAESSRWVAGRSGRPGSCTSPGWCQYQGGLVLPRTGLFVREPRASPESRTDIMSPSPRMRYALRFVDRGLYPPGEWISGGPGALLHLPTFVLEGGLGVLSPVSDGEGDGEELLDPMGFVEMIVWSTQR